MAVDELQAGQQDDIAEAQEYKPGELAPSIITQAQVWKPTDLDKIDNTMKSVITSLVEACSATDEAARRFSVLQTWEARHMDRGYQYLEDDGNGGWKIAATGTGGKTSNALAAGDDSNLYPTNVFSAQGDIITSALCRGEIKVNFAPRNSKNPQDVVCADEANKYKYIWDKANNKMDLQRDIMGTVWTDNRVISMTRSIADKNRFGTNAQGDPKVVEVTTIHGVLETKLPMMVDKLDQCGFAQVFEEQDYAIARASYPWMGTKIKPAWGTFGEQEFERIARINTRIGIVGKYITGTSGIRECTMGYTWLRPGMFFDDKVQAEKRDFLLKSFPDGCFVIMAGPEFVCCWNESMDDHLALGMPTRGFGQNRRALGSSDIPIQKRINIWADLWDKFVRTAIPVTILDGDTYNTEAMAQLEANPGRFIPAIPPEGKGIADTYGQTPSPTPIPGMFEMFQSYIGPLIQSIDGGTPALFGSGEGADNTVGATQIRLQQALERVGTPWIMANGMIAKAVTQAVKCCADNGQEEIFDSVPGVGDISVSPMNLKGDPQCFPETINGIPESGAQREAKVLQILDMANANPQIAAVIGTPSNAREIVSALHIDDVITIDEAESEDLALENVERLLDAEPLINPQWQQLSDQIGQMNEVHEQAKSMATQAVQSGQPVPPEIIQEGQQLEDQLNQAQQQLQQIPQYLPSITVATDESQDNGTIAATIFAWMQQPDGRNLRRMSEREQPGGQNWNKWMNVFLYWSGNKDQAAKTAASNVQPIPPKITISVPADKFQGGMQAEILSKAGIQVSGPSDQPHEVEQETRLYTPISEITTKTKRRL